MEGQMEENPPAARVLGELRRDLHPSKPVHLQIVSCLAGPWQAAWESEKAAIFELRTESGGHVRQKQRCKLDVYRTFSLKNIYCKGTDMTFQQLGIIPSILNALKKEAYTRPDSDSGAGDPSGLEKEGSFGLRPDGHGKDGGFRCANPSASCRTGQRTSQEDPRPGSHSHAGAGSPDSGELCGIWPLPSVKDLRDLRRRAAEPQVQQLKKGVDVLVATPGRLNDLIGQGFIKLKDVQIFVLDEADRNAGYGLHPRRQKVIEQLPKKRQTLLFRPPCRRRSKSWRIPSCTTRQKSA